MSLCAMSIQAANYHADPSVSEAVRPVFAAIDAARQRLRELPPPHNDSERLVRMGELDQAPRTALSQVKFSRLSEVQKREAWGIIEEQLQRIDEENKVELLAMVPAPDNWFSISRYGRQAATAAFLIVQHSDQRLWRRFLPAIERMAKTGEAEGPTYALMYDRLALSEGRPQRYGSQMACQGGHYVPIQPIEDPGNLDSRRTALHMVPYSQYLRLFEGDGC